jgi:hypothetical protein
LWVAGLSHPTFFHIKHIYRDSGLETSDEVLGNLISDLRGELRMEAIPDFPVFFLNDITRHVDIYNGSSQI